ncbi:hypothetical protein [Microbacterium sp. CH-015]|uniref:hypothetical protein n=1 Tax=Microbacterium sp. CH-015 TaxID=3406734 RepID=UPI003C778D93
MNRTLNVIRMQLVNRQTFVWLPIIILLGSFAMSLLIYGILASAGIDEAKYGAGAQAPLWYFLFVGIYALTLSFPFSQAMSVTRREFWAGTLLAAVLTAVLLGLVFVIGGLIEQATRGWGLNGYFFYAPWIWEHGAAAAGLFFGSLTLLVFVIGFGCATVYKRFGPLGLTIVLAGLGLLLVAALFVVARTESWIEMFSWFAGLTAPGAALWAIVGSAVIAAASYALLRRAVP